MSCDYHGNGTMSHEGAWDCVKVVTHMYVCLIRHSVNNFPPHSNWLDSFDFAMRHQARPTMSYILLVSGFLGLLVGHLWLCSTTQLYKLMVVRCSTLKQGEQFGIEMQLIIQITVKIPLIICIIIKMTCQNTVYSSLWFTLCITIAMETRENKVHE